MLLRSGRRVAHPPLAPPPPPPPPPPPTVPAPRHRSYSSSSHPTHGTAPDQICAPPASPRPRRRRQHQSGLDGALPDEILEEILTRLPAKSVLRCRAVCRSWRRLTTNPTFLASHHRRQPDLPLVTFFRHDSGFRPDGLDAVNLRNAELRPVFRLGDIQASCDGLFIVGSHICNPATRQWALLCCSRIDYVVGLYRHQPSEEYRVLYRNQSSIPNAVFCMHAYYVLTVGSGENPRLITHVPRQTEEITGAAVFLLGNLHLHWKDRIQVFDTVAEEFRQLSSPPINPRNFTRLIAIDGKLAMSASKRMMDMSIFVLEDYEHEVWAFRFRIKLPVMEIRRFQDQGDWLAKVVSEDGDVLVSCFGQLLHCDKRGNLVANFKYNDDQPAISNHRLKESLIQHAFFNR